MALNLGGHFKHSDRKCVRDVAQAAGRWPKIEPLNLLSRGDADEDGSLPFLRRKNEEERDHERRQAEVEVREVRGLADGQVRHHGGEARGVPLVAVLQGDPARDARAGKGLQEEDGRVLAGVAHAAPDGRGAQGRLRGRDIPGARPRGPHRVLRRARAVLVHGAVRDLEGLGGAALADPGALRRGHGRRERLRAGRARHLAGDAGPALRVPRVLPGEALHDLAPAPAGRRRALRARKGAPARREPTPGRVVVRALHAVVRVLGRLPRGEERRRREARLHAREAQEGEVVALEARQPGDPIHLPRSRARAGGAAALDEQPDRGRGERAAQGPPQEPQGPLADAEGEGRLLVVLPAHGEPPARAGDSQVDAHRRRRRPPLQDLLRRPQARGRGTRVGRQGGVGGAPPQGPVPVLVGLAQRHTFCPITPNVSLMSCAVCCSPTRL